MIPVGADGRVSYLPHRNGPVCLDGVLVADRIALEQWLAAQPGPLIAADLSLGGWRPGQLVAELAGELGVAMPAAADTVALPEGNTLDADAVGRWVDAEARGDAAIGAAESALRTLLPALRTVAMVVVAVPERAGDWREGDLWALRFLAAVAEVAEFRLMLVHYADSPAEMPGDIEVSWREQSAQHVTPAVSTLLDPSPGPDTGWLGRIPGLVVAPLAQALGLSPDQARQLVVLPSGAGLVPPELRAAAASDPHSVSELARRAVAVPWLATYAAVMGAHQDSGLLLGQAWRAFGAGAGDLACELAARGVGAATDARESVAALMAVQSIRLVGQDYAGLAAADPVPDDAPAEDCRRLDRFRAWGLALSGNGQDALDLFGGCPGKAPLDPQPWLDLYLRNISALALFRVGRADEALAVEHDIAKRMGRLDAPAWHLRYLNALNLSRLYRARGDVETAGVWLERAEAATLGAALPSDLAHFHVLRARLADDAGKTVAARRHWHAAALIFAALPLPETLGWRVATAIAGQPVRSVNPEMLAAALLDRLGAGDRSDDGEPAPAILLAELLPAVENAAAIGAPGWGVLATDQAVPPAFDGPSHAGLRRWLAQQARLDGAIPATLLVDLRHGLGLPDTLSSLTGSALWHGAGRLVWDGQARDLNALLDRAEQRITPSPGVAAIDGRNVTFKRHRQALTLSAAAVELLSDADRAIDVLTEDEQTLAAGLVTAGVLIVETRLGSAACAEGAGDNG